MSGNPFLSALRLASLPKRKVFVSYHHKGDQAYYDAFTAAFCNTYDVISDNSIERQIESDDPEYVMRRIRESYITGSSCTIVLVGPDTWGRKYVDWEIDATLQKEHGLIGVQLPTLQPGVYGTVSVPNRLNDNIQSKYALWVSWQQIVVTVQACTQFIEQASQRDKRLIVNSRARRLHNA